MYKIINRDESVFKSFKTKYDLLCWLNKKTFYISNGFSDYKKGVDKLYQCHKFLWRCGHNWNDTYIVYEKTIITEIPCEFVIKDNYNRIINVPDLAQKAYIFSKKEEKLPYKYIYNEWKPKKNTKYDLYQRRWSHKGGNYYRQQKTTQEMRVGYDEMHMPYLRAKRKPIYLERWNMEKRAVMQTSWKGMKIQYQWQEKL